MGLSGLKNNSVYEYSLVHLCRAPVLLLVGNLIIAVLPMWENLPVDMYCMGW